MSEEEQKETKDTMVDLLKEEPKVETKKEEKPKAKRKTKKAASGGRPRGSKNQKPSSEDDVTILIDEVKELRSQLEETKKQVADQKKVPVSVRLENRKKKHNLPPYSGPTRRVKFMRNDQPENPMNACLKKVVFTKKIDEKTGVETIVKEYLDWHKTLSPGRIYELPDPVVEFLNTRSEPTYEERADPENPRQTITTIVGEKHRCFCIPA